MQTETKGVIKLFTYQLHGKAVSKSTPGAIKVESKNWYITYYGRDGQQRRENSGTDNFEKAVALRNRRTVKTEDGETPAADLKSLRYEDLRAVYLRAKPAQTNNHHLKPIDDFFAGMKVYDKKQTVAKLRDYVDSRREDETSDPTIRRELVALRAMFNQAVKDNIIGANDVPYFPMPQDSAPAGQYILPKDFAVILSKLPEELGPFFQFMYATGCRLGAMRKIQWSMVSKDGTQINLSPEIVKTRKALLLVLAGQYLEPIAKMLRARFRDENVPVFNFDENYVRREWGKAVAAAGLGTWDAKARTRSGPRIHDCRCSAAINALAAGVDESTVLKLGGWKTRAMLDRYNVQDAGVLKNAMLKVAKHVASEQQAIAQ
jgi:integrase